MATIPYKVARAFLKHEKASIGKCHDSKTANFRSDGTTLYTYGVALAVWDKDGLTILSDGQGYSVTTSRHARAFKIELERSGIQVKEVK